VAKTLRVVIKGRILGMNLRARIQRTATKLNLRGYVRALPDRRLEVMATGTEGSLRELAASLRHDARDTQIGDIDLEWSDKEIIESRFTIKHSD